MDLSNHTVIKIVYVPIRRINHLQLPSLKFGGSLIVGGSSAASDFPVVEQNSILPPEPTTIQFWSTK